MEIISIEQQSINIQDGLFVRKTAKPTHTKKTPTNRDKQT